MIEEADRLRALEAENAALRRRVADLEAALEDRPPREGSALPFAAIFEGLPVPVVLYRPDGTAVAINRANEALVATPASAIVGQHNIFRDPQAVDKGYVRHFRAAMRGEVSRMPPTAYNTAEAKLDGRIVDRTFWSETTYFPIYDERGALLVVGEVNMDVTEQVSAEQAERRLNEELAERERRFRGLFHHSGIGIGIVTPDGVVVEVNPALVELLGLSREQQIGQRILQNTHPDDIEPDRSLFADLVAGRRERYQIEKRYRRHDGSLIYSRLTTSAVRRADGALEFVVRMVEDVTAQRVAEAAVRESQALLTAVIEQLPALVHVKDAAGRYVLVNSALAAMSGRSPAEMVGRSDVELYDPQTAAYYRDFDAEALRRGRAVQREDSLTVDGVERHYASVKFPLFDEAGRPYAVCGVALDISERKRAEEERLIFERRLRETQKLESLGLMAGGVAHDFNNLLVAILGNASVALEELPPGAPARHSLTHIELAARRAADLTRQLLAYAGKSHLSTQPLDLNALVLEMGQLLYTSVPRGVTLHYALSPELPSVEADATQMRQVIMNLVINAGEAIGEASGSVTVTTGLVQIDGPYQRQALLAAELGEGQYVCLTVSDTGHGMDATTRERIFEPFFSTKFAGRGLGLSAVIGIVRGHKGAISVYSEPSRGTTFRILLPAGSPTPTPVAPPPAPGPPAQVARVTALLVDDEPDVRAVAELMLQRLGFTVLQAADGVEGARLFHEHADVVDLALLDVTMPGMGGEELAGSIRAARPACRVVLMSGYTEHAASATLDGFLPKPFTLAELADVLRRALE